MITLFTRQKEENIDPVFDRSAWPAGTTVVGEYNTYAQQVVMHKSGEIAEVEKTQQWIEDEQGEIQQVKIQAIQPFDQSYLQGVSLWDVGSDNPGGGFVIVVNGEATSTLKLFSTAGQIESAIKSLPSILAEGGDLISVANLVDPIESQADLLNFTIEFDKQLGKQNLVEVITKGFIGQGIAEQESGIDDWILWGPRSGYKSENAWQWTEIDEFTVFNDGVPPIDNWIAVPSSSNYPYVVPEISIEVYVAGVNTQAATTTVTYWRNGEVIDVVDNEPVFDPPIQVGTVIITRTAQLTQSGLDVEITSETTGEEPEDYDYSEAEDGADIPVATIEGLARTAIAARKLNFKNNALESKQNNTGGVNVGSTTVFGEVLSGTGQVSDTKLEGILSKLAWEGKWMEILSVNNSTNGNNVSRKLLDVDFDITEATNLASGGENFYLDLDSEIPAIGAGEVFKFGWSDAIPGTPDLYYPTLGFGLQLLESHNALDYNAIFPSPAYSALST